MALIPDNKCKHCDGSGEIGGEFHLSCLGTGEIGTAALNSFLKGAYDALGLAAGIFPSYKVLKCLDATEHAALTDTQKDGVKHLLMCGLVDLNDGEPGKVRLWNWFGAESTTVTNLTALIT